MQANRKRDYKAAHKTFESKGSQTLYITRRRSASQPSDAPSSPTFINRRRPNLRSGWVVDDDLSSVDMYNERATSADVTIVEEDQKFYRVTKPRGG